METDQTAQRLGWVALATALVLAVPLVAMQFTDEVAWGPGDFVVAAVLLGGTGSAYVLASRKGGSMAYRAAVGVALAAALLLVWLNLAVGIIGSEGNPANLMYAGVLGVGIVGAALARLRPLGMARALGATAVAQALVGAIAIAGRMGPALQLLALNAMFAGLFAGSALLFRHVASERGAPGAAPRP